MNHNLRSLCFVSGLGLFLILALGAPAQENSPPPAADLSGAGSGVVPAPASAPVHLAPPARSMRSAENAAAGAADQPSAEAESSPAPAPTAPPQIPPPSPARSRLVDQPFRHRGTSNDPVVAIFDNATLATGEAAKAVVSVFGSSTSAGDVRDAVVSVFGNSRMTGGRVGDSVVSVFGNTYVNGEVRGQVVAVLGNVELGPDARVGGQIVCIAGTVTRDPHAVVDRAIQRVNIGARFVGAEGVQAWVTQCLLYVRPLAIGPHLAWLWWIMLGFLACYGLVALVCRSGVEKCAQTLEERPGFSLLAALLATLFVPVLIVLLIVTGIGIVFVPFVIAALFFASLFGRVVILAWLGRRVASLLGGGVRAHAAVATLLGGVIVLGLYLIPVVGFLVYKLIGVLGLGVVLYTLIRSAKRKAPPLTLAPAVGSPLVPAAGLTTPVSAEGGAGSAVVTAGVPAAEPSLSSCPPIPRSAPPALPPLPPTARPLAGFWIRLAASLLDALLVAIALRLLPRGWRPDFLLVYAGYCVVLWTLKATTIGGIVCGLKIVRLDGRPVDAATALVRALGGFLSLIAVGLGFIWVAFDDRRQSWHDKIAGTTVVVASKDEALV